MLLVQLQVADHDSSLVFSMGSGLKDCSQILDASGVSALGTVLKSHLRYNEHTMNSELYVLFSRPVLILVLM